MQINLMTMKFSYLWCKLGCGVQPGKCGEDRTDWQRDKGSDKLRSRKIADENIPRWIDSPALQVRTRNHRHTLTVRRIACSKSYLAQKI